MVNSVKCSREKTETYRPLIFLRAHDIGEVAMDIQKRLTRVLLTVCRLVSI